MSDLISRKAAIDAIEKCMTCKHVYHRQDDADTIYIADAEKDANMKSLSQEEAVEILSDMKIDIPVPKAAVTQRKRNVALDMAISALSCSEIPNSSDLISRQAAIDALGGNHGL